MNTTNFFVKRNDINKKKCNKYNLNATLLFKWHEIKPKNYIHKTKDFKREKSKDQKLNANIWYTHKQFIGTFIKINICLIADENKNIILPRETHISSYTVSCKVTANHSLKDSLRLKLRTQYQLTPRIGEMHIPWDWILK